MITSRKDLSFVRVSANPDKGIESHWDVPHDEGTNYSDGLAMGRQMFAEVAELAEHDALGACLAMKLPMNSSNMSTWQDNGWGYELGFMQAMAEAAVVGLRAVKAGLIEPYDSAAAMARAIEEAA